MSTYILNRLLLFIPTQQIRRELGLDRPVVVQYLDWIGGAVRGDFGQSYVQRRPVFDILKERFPRSMRVWIAP